MAQKPETNHRSHRYKIELKYSYGWDDAGWTDRRGNESEPTRFETLSEAETTLEEYFAAVEVAVLAGDMDSECLRGNYRIAKAMGRRARPGVFTAEVAEKDQIWGAKILGPSNSAASAPSAVNTKLHSKI